MPVLRCGLVLFGGIVEPERWDNGVNHTELKARIMLPFADMKGIGVYIRLPDSGVISVCSHSPELGTTAAHDLVLAY